MKGILKMKETFPLIPGSSGPIFFFLGLSVFFVSLVVLFGYLAYSSRHVRCQVSVDGLRVVGNFYGRRLPLEMLAPDGAKVLDLNRDTAYQMKWRTNGVGLPGYSAGWFTLRNGEKALVFLTDKRRVLYLPTRQGYAVLLSVMDPEGLLDALRRALNQAVDQSS